MSTILAKDEQIKREVSFITNIILFWLKANYTLTDKRITGQAPNTLFGLIPLGRAQVAQPLKTIASVSSSSKFHIWRLIIGGIFFLVGLATIGSSALLGLILLVLGVSNILNTLTATFVILNNGGQKVGYEMSILEKSKVEEFVNEVNSVIADL